MHDCFKVGAFAIIFDKLTRVLLCHRCDCDLWNLPGGGVMEGEAPWDGVVREVREEVGLFVRVSRLAGVYSKPDENEIVLTFVCTVDGGSLRTSDEADDIKYFDIDQLPSNLARNHIERIKDAVGDRDHPSLKVQPGPSSAVVVKAEKRGLNFGDYEVLTFDCYGTLIDWESGILEAIKPVLSSHEINLSDRQALEFYGEAEMVAEAGEYVKYRDVLRRVSREFGRRFGFEPSPSELNCLVDSLPFWRPFPDAVEALRVLKRIYPLAIISNIDDDLFALSAKHLEVEFDWVITAERVGTYKPSLDNFRFAIDRMKVHPDRVLHIAQSVYHDIVPAKRLGLSTVWVNRRKGQPGCGATPPPPKVQPDLEVVDLKSLVSVMELNPQC